jgi:cellulose synthase/poly-beta-1,6-N-acetylglucosamine synthase-like glycosyltransferase
MHLALVFLQVFLQVVPNPDDAMREIKRINDPILSHGRDNISYLYSLDGFDWTIILLYFIILMLLAILGLYRVRMVYQFWCYRNIKPVPKRIFAASELPRITVQQPLFNEMYVIERLLKPACELDYPRHLLDIQVLDDSIDESVKIAAAEVAKYKALGYDIHYIHRTDRTGFNPYFSTMS